MGNSSLFGTRYRTRPVEVNAFQWLGGDTDILDRECGHLNWHRAEHKGVPWNFDDTENLVIWNVMQKVWIPCPVDHWVIRGLAGELCPCEPHVFEQTYEPFVESFDDMRSY